LARVSSALIDVDIAIVSGKSWLAVAGVSRDMVNAFTVILAWASGAIIDVDFAVFASPSLRAFAGVIVDEIRANTTVLARA
jgi:hypothetical protein